MKKIYPTFFRGALFSRCPPNTEISLANALPFQCMCRVNSRSHWTKTCREFNVNGPLQSQVPSRPYLPSVVIATAIFTLPLFTEQTATYEYYQLVIKTIYALFRVILYIL